MKFLNLQPELFGLDINDSCLRLVKLKKTKGNFVIETFNELVLPKQITKISQPTNSKNLADLLKTAIKTAKGKKINTKYVALSLPEEKLFSQIIKIPNMPKKQMRQAVEIEAENYIPIPLEKVYLDFQLIQEPNPQSKILEVHIQAMSKRVVDIYVSLAKSAGLIPAILEAESAAFARALIGKNNQQKRPLILICLKDHGAYFAVFSENFLRFSSPFSFEASLLNQTLQNRLGFTAREAEKIKVKYGISREGEKKYNTLKTLAPVLDNLAEEIKKYIDFYKSHLQHKNIVNGENFEKIILSGQQAHLKGLDDFLNSKLGIKSEMGNPLINIKSNSIIPAQKVMGFSSAIGLAMRNI